jgi:hypothetical protein
MTRLMAGRLSDHNPRLRDTATTTGSASTSVSMPSEVKNCSW